MRLLLLTVLLMLAGCAAPEARWHADVRFTAEERAAIESGVAWLEAYSGREVGAVAFDYEATDETPLGHTIRRERGPLATGQCVSTTVYLGMGDSTIRPIDREGFTAHELAHCALGLVDDPQSDGLMRVITPARWTDREAAQVASPK